jgi:hypothetical protein
MRLIFTLCFVLCSYFLNAQSIKSPDSFLGYKLGSYYTEHYQVVNYFNSLASEASDKVIVKKYGETNEHKSLIYAIISSPENIKNIEEIRKNSMRLSGELLDKPAVLNMPTIVWLSYNVHGNEASSTETAMKVAYELAAGKNVNINNWLKNTVVIIDPCLNPDGRDRYVHWFNGLLGAKPQPKLMAREHDEPWPSGRFNHYYFDLNRDWAWQTQVETQQRIKIYNEWMPTIHCDFHEQYINDPYYFAPAAEPFHEAITPFQRSFQNEIGKNHAKYFDQNGWLYFTREIFDLFYPSYGDTYPTFNGSVGMTYEQAGHTQSGLSVVTDEDTLTLYDRIAHHFTTSISTIEIAAQNAEKINSSFKKYFEDQTTNGSGNYKSYLINGSNKQKLNEVIILLDKNKIKYGFAKEGVSIKGFSYIDAKEKSYKATNADLVISTFQPKGALVNVLFEPNSKLADSVTYDITAWSLPYVYGLDAYAVKDKISVSNTIQSNAVLANPSTNSYAYLLGYKSFNDSKLLTALLNIGIKVRYAESPFKIDSKNFDRGTLIVLNHGNEDKLNEMMILVKNFNADVTPVPTGFMESGFDFGSEKIHLIKKKNVAIVVGENTSATAVGEVWNLFDQELKYELTLINSSEISNLKNGDVDVLIFVDGEYKMLSDKESSLKNWVRDGGKIIALENAVKQMSTGEWGIKMKKEPESTDSKDNTYTDLKRYEKRERDNVAFNTPGAIYKVELDDSHPLAFGYNSNYFSLKMNNVVYEFLKEGWNVGVIKKEGLVAGYVGSNTKESIKDGTVFGVQSFGKGTVVYFADDLIFRSFWQNGKMMFANAVFLVD